MILMSDTNHNCDLSVIIVNFNTKALLQQCLKSIYETQLSGSFEVIMVDNASKDGSIQIVREQFPQVKLIENQTNVGFSRANNIGIRIAKGRYLLLLNSDTVVLPGAIDNLVKFLEERQNIAAVGPMLLNNDESLQRSWFDFPSAFKTFSHIVELSPFLYKLANIDCIKTFFQTNRKPAFMIKQVHEPMCVDYLSLACLLIRREVFESIGLLDEELFFYHEDCELGYRAYKKHLSIYYLPDSHIIHLGGSSSSQHILMTFREYFKSLLYVFRKHEGASKTILLRFSIISGMLFRSLFWFFGSYRRIRVIDIYSESTTRPSDFKPSAIRVLATYLQIIRDSLKPAAILKYTD